MIPWFISSEFLAIIGSILFIIDSFFFMGDDVIKSTKETVLVAGILFCVGSFFFLFSAVIAFIHHLRQQRNNVNN